MSKLSNSKLRVLVGLVLGLTLGVSGCAATKPKMILEVSITVGGKPSDSNEDSDSESAGSESEAPAQEDPGQDAE